MPRAVIAYDKDLPEIPGRRPWEKPTSNLVRDEKARTGWREETSGRRPSRLLLVPKIRAAAPEFYEELTAHTSWTRLLFRFLFDPEITLYSRMTRESASGHPRQAEALAEPGTAA